MTSPKPSAPNWPVRLAVAVVVLALIVWGIVYLLRPIAMVSAAIRDKAVKAVPGTVEVKAEFTVELKSEVAGRVQTSSLLVGKHVKQGEVLVQIDTGDVDLAIAQIKADLVAAKKKVELGSPLLFDEKNDQDKLDDLERQTKAGQYPVGELEKARRTHQQLVMKRELDEVQLKQALDTLENSLLVKERERSKMTITAPSDGIVTLVEAREGELIGANSTIANIISIGRTVEGKLTEEKFAQVKLGQKATVHFFTFGADQYDAKVTKILPSADPTTQRYTVFLDVALPEGRELVPGLTGELFITIAERSDAVLVPSRAIVGDHLYVVDDGKIELRQIEKGYESLNLTEVRKGVKPGEQIVVDQMDRFHPGDRVRTQDAKE